MIAERTKTLPEGVGPAGVDVAERAQWSPPEAPLDMPPQVLERAGARVDMTRLLYAFLPRQRA